MNKTVTLTLLIPALMIVSAVLGATMVAQPPTPQPWYYVFCPEGDDNCIRILPSEIKIYFKD